MNKVLKIMMIIILLLLGAGIGCFIPVFVSGYCDAWAFGVAPFAGALVVATMILGLFSIFNEEIKKKNNNNRNYILIPLIIVLFCTLGFILYTFKGSIVPQLQAYF